MHRITTSKIKVELSTKMESYSSRFDWHQAVDDTVNSALGKCYPRDWKDEDYLTRSLLFALKNEHSNVTIEQGEPGKNAKCHWDVYKNTKEQGIEQKHGDIGILVQLRFGEDKILEGVAFLEAKRIYHNQADDSKSRFSALDMEQLKRYCNNSSFHRTVFYDCVSSESGISAFSATIPTRHLITINSDDRAIYPHCEYLSYCLTDRYLQGYELDFDPDLVASVKGFLDANGGVKYLVVAQSILGPDIDLNPNLININKAIYKALEAPAPGSKPKSNLGGPTM